MLFLNVLYHTVPSYMLELPTSWQNRVKVFWGPRLDEIVGPHTHPTPPSHRPLTPSTWLEFGVSPPEMFEIANAIGEFQRRNQVKISEGNIEDEAGRSRNLWRESVRRILGRGVTLSLVSAFVTTRLDYCNSVLAGLPQASIDPLQRVQKAAARLVAGIGTRDHITFVLRSLHWLPIKLRIQFKLCVLLHQVHIGRSPAYLADMMTATADLPGRERLRSANSFWYFHV